MKSTFKWMTALVVAVFGFALASCSHDKEDDQIISYDSLPQSAKQFVGDYFAGVKVVTVVKDDDHKQYGGEYEVRLADGTEVSFNRTGEWVDVDCIPGKVIPAGIAPQAIDTYIAANYPQAGINEITKDHGGYEVELTTGVELIFSANGDFIRVDR